MNTPNSDTADKSRPEDELIETCDSRYAAAFGLWVAVAKAQNPCDAGAAYDLALGLGMAKDRFVSEQRAKGEALERYGAAVGGACFDQTYKDALNEHGMHIGQVLSREVYLPWIGPQGPALPCRSDGLAFGNSFSAARAAAQKEWVERWALKQGFAGRNSLQPQGELDWGGRTARIWHVAAPFSVVLAVIADSDGAIYSAGAGASDIEDVARQKALEELTLATLCRDGEVLPGLFTSQETFLARYGVTHVRQLEQWKEIIPALPTPKLCYAVASPMRWADKDMWVVRALPKESIHA